MSEEAAGLLATTRYVGAEVEVDVEERVERMAAGFGEGPARSPEADETAALRREIVRLRAALGGS